MNIAKKTAVLGLMFSLMIILSYLEGFIPPLPGLPPQMKMGLANIVSVFCILYIGKKEAILLNILKSFFVGMTRGFTAFLLSFTGGIFAILIMILLIALFNLKISYIMLSISGAICHNLGQLFIYIIMSGTYNVLYYVPILLLSGIVSGFITGIIIRTSINAINKTNFISLN